jgi:hypothetical protein
MIQSVSLLFLLRIISSVDCTTRIGSINSTAYVPVNSTNVILYNITYSQCVCSAFITSIPPTYQAFNFYADNNTCSLYTSFLSWSYLLTDTHSKFAFLQLPSINTTPGNVFFIQFTI